MRGIPARTLLPASPLCEVGDNGEVGAARAAGWRIFKAWPCTFFVRPAMKGSRWKKHA